MGTRIEIPIVTIEDIRQVVREELERAQAHDRLLDAHQAAGYLNVKVRTIWVWRKESRLPYVEVSPGTYRFRESDLKRFLSERTKKEPTPTEHAATMVRRVNSRKGKSM